MNQNSGRFWTMDEYEGGKNDPNSLHKYTYCGSDPINSRDPLGHMSLLETNLTESINSTLNTISSIHKTYTTVDNISSVFDLISALWSLAAALQGGQATPLFNLVGQTNASSHADSLRSRGLMNLAVGLFDSVLTNVPKIVEVNVANRPLELIEMFKDREMSVLFYLPGFTGALQSPPLKTGIRIAGKWPLKISTQGGGAIMGMGLQSGQKIVQLFHLDLIIPGVGHGGHEGPSARDYDSWLDGRLLNYQVPK